MGVQVQTATRDGQGNSLSILNRQFISFSYGGKNIEDFDLLAVFDGDRLSKEIYAPFNDTTTEQAELDGQIFWRSNFKAGQLNFSLATDGMTSQQLEDFKNWFKPGIERELILSEHNNRGILARVSSAPQISLLPFEEEVEINIAGEILKTKTSLYKGEISLSFVMDEPFWYSIQEVVEDFSKESLKIIYEDGIPHKEMFKEINYCLLANNKYYSNNDISLNTEGIELSGSKQIDNYLYYCGTAPSKPIISFNILPNIEENTGKIYFPSSDKKEYCYFAIGQDDDEFGMKYLYFDLPSLFTSYNNVINILSKYQIGNSILDLRREIRDNTYNYYTRSWAIAIIDFMRANSLFSDIHTGALSENFDQYFIKQMKRFLPQEENYLNCIFNSQNGEVIISGTIASYNPDGQIDEENDVPLIEQTISENAGNMVKSNYLIIETRKLPKKGLISEKECLALTTNTELSNLKIDYKYMYL